MTDTNFPAPTVAAPIPAGQPEQAYAPAYDAAADARTTAEYARTIGAATPSDSKAPASEPTITIPFGGKDIVVYKERFSGEVQEWMERGIIVSAIKTLIGDEQWNQIKGWHMRDIRQLLVEIGKADVLGK